jgi:UPF0755 protein
MLKPGILTKTAVIVLLVLTAAYSAYLLFQPPGGVIVTIPENSTGEQIARILKDNGLVPNERVFLFLADLTGSARKLKKGAYLLSRRMSSLKMIFILRSGKTYTQKVTVPEGFTLEQIAVLLEQKGLARKDDFIRVVKSGKLEGFLFPETYFIESGMTSESIAAMMRAEFEKKYGASFSERAKELGMTTTQVVTLASLIEKEAKVDSERVLISGIFHNRLRKGWLLESCASVRYALAPLTASQSPKEQSRAAGQAGAAAGKDKLTYKDLNADSPYNTYRRRGLPPGPICSPGLPSIKAALYPEKTDLMFFFSSGCGTHEFSRYYENHLKGQRGYKK